MSQYNAHFEATVRDVPDSDEADSGGPRWNKWEQIWFIGVIFKLIYKDVHFWVCISLLKFGFGFLSFR